MRRIHTCLVCQLGNCLRNVASIKILADHAETEWDIDLNQSIAWPEPNTVIKELFPKRIVRHPPDSYPLLAEHELLRFIDIYGTNSHPIVEAIISKIPSFDFGIRHIYAFRPSSMTDADYIQKKLAFYNQDVSWPIHLIENVKQFADDQANGSLANFIGCHIRYTDNLRDTTKERLNLNTSLSTFIERLKLLGEQPILLCTDNYEVRNLVAESLANSNILFPDACSENPQLWQPLYEMLLLSQTKYLIGSQSSTFSYETSFIKGIDLEVYKNNSWHLYPISQYIN